MVNQNIKKRALHRAKIIKGQLEGLIKAIENEEYCIDLITQSLAIQRSMSSLDAHLLENHLKSHVKDHVRSKEKMDKTIAELVKIYTLSNK